MSERYQSIRDYQPSIYPGADGRWHGRIIVAVRPDGSYMRLHRSAVKRGDVVRKIKKLEADRDAGYAWENAKITLGAWLQHWLTDVVQVTRQPKTFASYSAAMNKHVIPELGGVPLEDLQTEHLDRLYHQLLKAGHSDHVVHSAHRVLRSSLSEAVRRKRLLVNPASHAAVKAPEEVEIQPLLVHEMSLMGSQARLTPNAARWSLALALGLRQGEALGVRWKDIDFESGTIQIRYALQRLTWRHGCGEDAVGWPRCGAKRGGSCPDRHSGGLLHVRLKTKSSRRDVSLPSYLVKELEAHRKVQIQQRLQASSWNDMDLVFCTPKGAPIDPKHDGAAWHRLLEEAGLRRVRLHDARHSAASMLLALGIDQRVVMEIMGWTDLRTARRYMHVVDQQRQEVAMKIDHVLGGGRSSTG